MQCTVRLGAADAFALISDFHLHERWIPFTTIEAPYPPLSPGDQVVAVTVAVFTDRMRIVEATAPDGDAPGVLRLRKEGPILRGDAVITVEPLTPTSATIQWDEDVWLAGPLPAGLTRVALVPAFAAMLTYAMHRLQRDAAALADIRDARRG